MRAKNSPPSSSRRNSFPSRHGQPVVVNCSRSGCAVMWRTMTDPRIRCQIRLLLVALLAPLAAAADVIDYVNSVRRHGCGGHAGGLVPLRESTRLDEVARQLAQGAELRAAQQLAGYHAASAFSVQISGVPPSGDVGRVIARQYCEQSTNPAFREIGTFQRGADVCLALEGADLAEGGIGALLAELPRDDAPHVPARGHARDLHRERSRACPRAGTW